MQLETVYIHKIEGTEVWIPVKARRVSDNQFELLNDKEFNDLDEADRLDNYPGDIVTLQEHVFSDGEMGKVVKELIYRPKK